MNFIRICDNCIFFYVWMFYKSIFYFKWFDCIIRVNNDIIVVFFKLEVVVFIFFCFIICNIIIIVKLYCCMFIVFVILFKEGWCFNVNCNIINFVYFNWSIFFIYDIDMVIWCWFFY